ncbi:hypothetical protein LX32DRAFT_640961 [Colletotrichum zoysiae]|uniref:Uncharacterized protein n=1 Tax=Colletotrichum zoysiae TaxID=1216348 RepID=A0AAD9M005_9PEZI|nr:hypothetical protein LX32DRAFT_640961 [Colletotrichum zoysiae]
MYTTTRSLISQAELACSMQQPRYNIITTILDGNLILVKDGRHLVITLLTPLGPYNSLPTQGTITKAVGSSARLPQMKDTVAVVHSLHASLRFAALGLELGTYLMRYRNPRRSTHSIYDGCQYAMAPLP